VSVSRTKPAAVILAAGESRRMGTPKVMLPFRGGTFLSVLADTLATSCSPVYAVFGHDAETLIPKAPASVVAIENPDYPEGMLTSLQAGLRAIPDLPKRIVFTLVDHPALRSATLFELLQADEAPLVIPRYAGKRGHPVIMSREIAREILTEPVTSKLNHVMDRHAAEILYIDVNDPAVRDDIDNPQLYESLLAREGARV
jgi:molybdenum cofactor cytidylyltransferase